MSTRRFAGILKFAMLLVFCGAVFAPAHAQQSGAPLSKAQLEQLVAPIALHPDPLLSQMLMASTYPTEVVQAARWAKELLASPVQHWKMPCKSNRGIRASRL